MKKWQVLASTYLTRSPFGSIRQDTCLLPNGRIIEGYNVNEYPEWVNVVAITKDRQIIFVRQYRHGCGDFLIEIPGGITKEGEQSSDTIARELREETGFVSDKVPILIGSFFTNPALATNRIKTFLIQNAYKKYGQETDDTEDLDVLLIPMGQVEEMIARDEISQLFTVAAYYLAKDYLRKQSSCNE